MKKVENRDRIRICEDTDGDHVADKFTVFADGLSIPAAIVIIRGGAVVQNGRKTVFLKDTDGDDVADQSTTLITGWGLGDTHGGVSNFRYGLDNWIWAMQGYNYSSPRYGDKKAQSFSQGFWRFKLSQADPPQVTDLEFVRSSDNNTWGLGISEEGLIFGSTANRNPSMFMPIPNRYYERVRGWAPKTLHSIANNHLFDPITDKVRQVDHHGGYTAAAGHALYTARAFPEQWWNNTAFVCGPTGHLVGTFALRRDGANYTSTNPVNLLASDDEWSAPIMAEVGPDGAVWVIDWYNYIVQHNPTPHGFETGKGAAYVSDLRDKKHGRIYRVVASRGGKKRLHEYTSLADATNEKLVSVLSHPSFRWRLQAQRLLVERNADDVSGQLFQLLANKEVDGAGLNVGAIHALHTLHALGHLDLEADSDSSTTSVVALKAALEHESAGVRRNAIAVLPLNQRGLDLLLQSRHLFDDSDAQVKLQAFLTLADMPASSQAGTLVAKLASIESDPVLIDALTSAASTHAVSYLQNVTTNSKKPNDATLRVSRQVAEHISRSGISAQELQAVISALFDADSRLSSQILDGLIQGFPTKSKLVSNKLLDATLVKAFEGSDSNLKGKLLQLSGRGGITALDKYSEEVIAELEKTITNEEGDAKRRQAAAQDLVALRPRDPDVVETIVEQVTPQTSLEVASNLLGAINASDAPSGGEVLMEYASSMTPAMRSIALKVVLGKPVWVKSLLAAAEANRFDLNDLALDQKQSLRSFPDRSIREKAEKLLSLTGGLPDADREKVLQSLLHVTKKAGDVDAGHAVFKKSCAACHQHGEMGHEIGPNFDRHGSSSEK